MAILASRRATLETWVSAWSEPDERRRLALLDQATTATCSYIDPHTELTGRAAISDYMAGFQASAPGARFVTQAFETHHDRCILHWHMVDGDSKLISPGVSAGHFDAQGKLQQMVGFFGA